MPAISVRSPRGDIVFPASDGSARQSLLPASVRSPTTDPVRSPTDVTASGIVAVRQISTSHRLHSEQSGMNVQPAATPPVSHEKLQVGSLIWHGPAAWDRTKTKYGRLSFCGISKIRSISILGPLSGYLPTAVGREYRRDEPMPAIRSRPTLAGRVRSQPQPHRHRARCRPATLRLPPDAIVQRQRDRVRGSQSDIFISVTVG